jgi:hypothetical protein
MWLFVAWAVVANSVVLLYVAWSLLTGRSVEHFSSFLHDPGPGIPMAAVGTLASIALTICQVAVARRAMRATVAAKSEWPLVAGMLVVTVPIGILLAASIWVIFRAASHGVDVFAVTSATALMISALFIACGCLVSVALGALVAAVASMMLLHRLIWPLANRLLYALGRYRLVQNKLALNAVGATLTGIAITGTYGWQAILSHFGVA